VPFYQSTVDPFDMAEPNPNLTDALESSLWELYSHKKHYHPAVSTLVKVLEEAFTKPSYAMEDFLDHTYGTVSYFYLSCGIRPDGTEVD
jgi:U3 small nucleolar RNA-associated protein 19